MTIGSRAPGRASEPVAIVAAGQPALLRAATNETARFAARAAGHGGRLAAAMAAYPNAPRPWLDLSTGINPEPWRGPRATYEDLARLPDPARLAALEDAAARAFGVDDPARVLATAGAEAALRLIPRVLPVGDVDVVSPTYASHEAAWRSGSRRVGRIDVERMAASTAELLVLVNPNNPDGHEVSRDAVAAMVRARAERRLWTVVDESFVETAPDLSVAGVGCDRLLVLRSFGKFYGLAGLRLGFVIAPAHVAARLREAQGEWPVGVEAAIIGAAAYRDEAWRSRTRAALHVRTESFDRVLTAHGLQVVGGTNLFRLVSVPQAQRLFDGLCRAGVLVRPFAQREDWLRFGLPRREDFARVEAALEQAAP